MPKLIDLTNMTFGRWTVIERSGNDKHGKPLWLCRCSCESKTLKVVIGSSLRDGKSLSCGCLIIEATTKHGLSNTRIKSIYTDMKQRCMNERNKNYGKYGGRGIKICDDWIDEEKGFQNFYNWSMENGYEEHLTIDRKNVNGNYEPDNCRWVDMKTQQNNKRNNHRIEIDGVTKTISEWADFSGISFNTLWDRVNRNKKGREILMPLKK